MAQKQAIAGGRGRIPRADVKEALPEQDDDPPEYPYIPSNSYIPEVRKEAAPRMEMQTAAYLLMTLFGSPAAGEEWNKEEGLAGENDMSAWQLSTHAHWVEATVNVMRNLNMDLMELLGYLGTLKETDRKSAMLTVAVMHPYSEHTRAIIGSVAEHESYVTDALSYGPLRENELDQERGQ